MDEFSKFLKKSMQAIAILGTSSNAGKSWLVTALGAWLRRQGVRVAPFKSQNMSNNSYVTLEGGEIGRAQAVQAIACGLRPIVEMNPILLKPSGAGTSQLVVLGQSRQHIAAIDYYQHIENLWSTVVSCLEFWGDRCDVLLLEGAGSPVELNLMHRDLVNLRPILHLGGKWLLVGDIEKGGVFAQIIGTHYLMPADAQVQGLGLVVNKFRGDLRLFAEAEQCFNAHISVPYLGVLPFANQLQPESEDSLCAAAETKGSGAVIAWIRFPHLSNSQDVQPWQLDQGVQTVWVTAPEELWDAKVIILPGSKNTIADLQWLYATGLAQVILAAAARGVPIVGICGGYQMLGKELSDRQGIAGTEGNVAGLGLLPVRTNFLPTKQVQQVEAIWRGDRWLAYEIHMGQTTALESLAPLLQVLKPELQNEGWRSPNQLIWGTYIHGLFESSQVRQDLVAMAPIPNYQPSSENWQSAQQNMYGQMADLLETHLDLSGVRAYLGI